MQKQKSIWGKHEGKPTEHILIQGGYCCLELNHFPGGWAVKNTKRSEPQDEFMLSTETGVQHPENSHLFQTGRSDILYIQPALPPKPVVFRNNKTVSIRPHQTLRIYIAVPLYVQLYYKVPDSGHLLAEYETERLSDTWFGEPDSGTPAFSVGSRFSLHSEELQISKHEALIPINIQNTSIQLLELQRLIIRVELMNLYLVGQQMVSDLTSIEFKGPDQSGHLQFATDKNIHGTNPALLSKARQASNRNILEHSFHFIKQMAQL